MVHSCRPRESTGMGTAGTQHSTASGSARGTQGTAPEDRADTGLNILRSLLELSRNEDREQAPRQTTQQYG
jgi:hypothetical protein